MNAYWRINEREDFYLSVYGYIRVSSKDQKEDRQQIALKEVGVDLQNIYVDKQSGKDLMGTFLSDIVLQVLSFVAENERTKIKQRQAEGIAAAKAQGIKFGRPPLPLPDNFYEVHKAWRSKKITLKQAA